MINCTSSNREIANCATSSGEIPTLVTQQRRFFNSGQTRSLNFRLTQLKRLKQGILDHQGAIVAAAQTDLGRPEFEAYLEMTLLQELNITLQHLGRWMKPQAAPVPLYYQPCAAWIQPEPLGVVLIIAPWNYPFQLAILPLIGAIAAGNCAVIKPSELTPQTSGAIATLIANVFEPCYVAVVEGGMETSQQLLAEKFDHIFFTGSTQVGKRVMAAAAQHLTPVTLELGGKSPCLVDRETPLAQTARRIAWGKFLNAGQTCIAPDYVLVDRTVKTELIHHLGQAIHQFFGPDPAQSPDFARIVNDRHFDRLHQLLATAQVAIGGQTLRDQRYIAPTLLDPVTWEEPVMQTEIFGPLLPILTYDTLEEAIAQINARPKPLALYLFSQNRQKQKLVLTTTASGGICLNDTVLQFTFWSLPFGGVGESGMGAYHGKASFETFSHRKSVVKKPFGWDLWWRYAPYRGKLNFLKKVIMR